VAVRHCGAVLPLTLVYATLLALVSAAVAHTAALQFRMAGNELAAADAQLRAEGLVLELAARRDNFDLALPVGHRRCTAEDPGVLCDSIDLPAPVATAVPAGAVARCHVTREAPPVTAHDSGSVVEDYALFEVAASIRGGYSALGNADVAMGVAVPLTAGAPRVVYWRNPAIDPL